MTFVGDIAEPEANNGNLLSVSVVWELVNNGADAPPIESVATYTGGGACCAVNLQSYFGVVLSGQLF